MRLLEADLKNNGVYPVWFNAWHYQKEDHLLAYLLEAIRKQAVPRLHTLQGLRLRAGCWGCVRRGADGRWQRWSSCSPFVPGYCGIRRLRRS